MPDSINFFNVTRDISQVQDHSCILRPCWAIVHSLCYQFRSMVLRNLNAKKNLLMNIDELVRLK